MLLGHPRVIGFRSWDAIAHSMVKQFLDGALIKQFFDSILFQAPTYSARGISRDFVVRPTYILDLKVISHHSHHPPMPNGIQIGCHHDISQRVIVDLHEEGLILQILPKLISYGPFESQELQFRRVVLGLTSLKAMTGIGYGMVSAINLLLGGHRPQSLN